MTYQHYVTTRPGEDIFSILRRWRETAPPGHRGNIYIRHPRGSVNATLDDFRNEEVRDLNMLEEDILGSRRLAVQSVADQLAVSLLSVDGAGVDDGPLAEAIRRRRVA